MSSSSLPLFEKLNSNNYNNWNGDMEAWFRAQSLWHIVSGVTKPPTVSQTPKDGEEEKLEAWQLKADKAAGIMWLMVDNNQRVHFRGIKDDPVKMWTALQDVHMQKRPGTRFNAYDNLFSIRKREDEDLQSLINRVDDALHRIRDLRSTGFTLDKLDDELGSMALIRALPDDYSAFVSSLLLKDDLDKAAVQNAFVREDNQHQCRQEESSSIGTAMATSTTTCDFCGGKDHTLPADCKSYARAKENLVKYRNKRKEKKANNTSQAQQTPAQATSSASQATEFAGNASDPSASSSSTPPNFDWLADTGATSHMTPHRHWVRNYSPFAFQSGWQIIALSIHLGWELWF